MRGIETARPPSAARWSVGGRREFYGRAAWWLAASLIVSVDVAVWSTALRSGFDFPALGGDLTLHRDAARDWLTGAGWYEPYQLTGPYDVWGQEQFPILYPPPVVLLLLPFLVLPDVLWWAIPIVGTALIVAGHRPRWTAVLLVVGLAAFPSTVQIVWVANPTMWVVFALALATRWPAFGPLVALKPTLAPFALYGIRTRQWWIGAAILGLVSLAFLPMWPDYLRASLNALGSTGWLYSVWHAIPMMIPLVVFCGRR